MPFHQNDFDDLSIKPYSLIEQCMRINALTFTGYINALCHDIGVQGSKEIEGYSKAKIKYMIYDHYQKIWELRLNLNPKARFYRSFKVDINFEPYLNTIYDHSLRVVLSKFRLSDHELNIEAGRHRNVKRDE